MKFKIYTTPSCGYCKPYIEDVKELTDNIEVVDVMEMPKKDMEMLGVMSVPYTVVYDDEGIYVDSWVGNSMNKVRNYI